MQTKPTSAPAFVPKASGLDPDASPSFSTGTLADSTANFVQVAGPTADVTVSIPASQGNASESSTFVSGNILADMTTLREGSGPQSCYIPVKPFPEYTPPGTGMGDWGDWNRGLLPRPAPCNPDFLPTYPVTPVPNTSFHLPSHWAVQDKGDTPHVKTRYVVLSPFSFNHLTEKILARCENEADARLIANTLNEKNKPAKAKKGQPFQVPANSCPGCSRNCEYQVDSEGNVIVPDSTTSEPIPKTENEYNFGTRFSKLGRLLTYVYAKSIIQRLEGRILTVIDASIPAEPQNKALKSILKREFRQSLTDVHTYAYSDDDCSDEEVADEDSE